jgi:hypothetical protein
VTPARAQTVIPTAREIALSANGAVWIIGANPVPGGYGLHQHDGNGGFTAVPGGAVRIAVGPDGQPWVINDAGNILRRVYGTWEEILEAGPRTGRFRR